MKFFNFFKNNKSAESLTTENGVLGPVYLDGLTENIPNPKKLKAFEWRRKLKSPSGQTKFKIKYWGQLHHSYNNLIVSKDLVPQKIFAIDAVTGEEILLFDGCIHGFNGIFCDRYTTEQLSQRSPNTFYIDKLGNEAFEIIMSTYYNINFEEEGVEYQFSESETMTLADGTNINFEQAKRNGFDELAIYAIPANGKAIQIACDELA